MADTTRLQKFYIAYYGRPADPEGLAYWASVLDNKLKGNEILLGASFGNAAQAEFSAIYGASTGSATAFINQVYVNLFGRAVDSVGLAYWQDVYTKKVVTEGKDPAAVRAEMVMYILDGAQGSDATIVANKTTAAVSFTAGLDTAAEQVAFVNAVLAAPGANAGTTTLAAVGATTTAAQITSLVDSGIASAVSQAEAASIKEIALSASATVRTFTGTAGKDKFVATLGDSLKDGDKIVGSLESDTLDLRSNGQNGSTILTTMDGVETVVLNNRSATTLDVGQWSGVTLFEVAATSSGGATLTLNNAEHATTIALNDSVSALTVNFEDTTGANDTVRLNLGNLGSTTQESLTFAGNNEAVVITASGTASILLDASAEAITVGGSGRLTLDLGGDLVSSVNASTLSDGGLTLRVSAADSIAITGTNTGDTITFTNAFTSADVLNGGGGTDTLVISALTSATTGNVTSPGVTGTTNFETITVNASGIEYAVTLSSAAFSTINLSEASSTTTFNVLKATPGTQVAVQSITTAGGAITIGYSGTDAVDVGTIVLSGSATNTATTVRVSGIDTATISAAGSGTKTFTSVSVDDGAETVSVSQGKSGNLVISTLLVSGAVTDLTFGATDNGELTVNGLDRDQSSSFDRLNVTNLVVTTSGGSGTVTLSPAMSFNSGLAKVTITGSNSSDVYLGVISANEGAVIDLDVVLTNEAGLGANGGQGLSIYINNSGSIDANIAVGSGIAYATAINAGAASGTISALSIVVGASGTYVGANGSVAAKVVAASTLTAGAEGSLTLGGIDADSTVGLVTITQTSSGLVSVGTVAGSGIAGFSITAGQTSTVTVGSITDGKTFGTITGTLAKDADLVLDVLAASGTTTAAGFGGVSISAVGASATVNLGSATIAGTTASIGIGDISVSGTTNVRIDLEGLRATATIGSLTLTAGTSGTIAVSGITSDTKSIGNISLTMGAGGVISVGDIQAVSSTIGTVSINGASATTIAGLKASAIGNITLGSGNTTVSGEFVATNFGSITINTDRVDLNVSALEATNITMGAVVINGSGVTFDVGSAQGSVTMASLTVSNTSGTTNIDLGSAAAVTSGIVLNAGGSVVLDLSSGAAAQTVSARASANTIYLSTKGDTIELAPSTGLDRLYIDRGGLVSASAGLTEATIRGFDFASSTTEDKIYLGGSASLFGLLSAATYGASAGSTDALNVLFVKSAGEALSIDNEDGTVMSATQLIIIGTGVDIGSIQSALKWIGTSGNTSVVASAAQVGVMFYNASGQNTQLWVVGLSATLASTFTATAAHEADLIATFDSNIERFSGSTFNDTFNHG